MGLNCGNMEPTPLLVVSGYCVGDCRFFETKEGRGGPQPSSFNPVFLGNGQIFSCEGRWCLGKILLIGIFPMPGPFTAHCSPQTRGVCPARRHRGLAGCK